jgi:hypothetical protein
VPVFGFKDTMTRYYKCKECKFTWDIFVMGLQKPELPTCKECGTVTTGDLIQTSVPHGSWNVTASFNL